MRKTSPKPPCRLFPIFARESSLVCIFRRGPSKWTQLILWNTETDEVIPGQWLKGRIYERRCDLSPDGTKLLYFAQKLSSKSIADTEYTHAWTAISKPPYLTALALWPKGDCWHGGGFFRSNSTVFLNHKPDVASPHPDHLPKGLRIIPNPNACGEDDPIFGERLQRDGWKEAQDWKITLEGHKRMFVTHKPEIRVKSDPTTNRRISLTRRIDRLKYSEAFAIEDDSSKTRNEIKNAAWVDFDLRGRLVVLKEGKLFAERGKSTWPELLEIADFNQNLPADMITPVWAAHW